MLSSTQFTELRNSLITYAETKSTEYSYWSRDLPEFAFDLIQLIKTYIIEHVQDYDTNLLNELYKILRTYTKYESNKHASCKDDLPVFTFKVYNVMKHYITLYNTNKDETNKLYGVSTPSFIGSGCSSGAEYNTWVQNRNKQHVLNLDSLAEFDKEDDDYAIMIDINYEYKHEHEARIEERLMLARGDGYKHDSEAQIEERLGEWFMTRKGDEPEEQIEERLGELFKTPKGGWLG